jgi:predicted acetyltransferase
VAGAVAIELRLPQIDEEAELLRARAATYDVPTFLHYYAEGMSLARYLEVLAGQARGEDLPPNHVASTFLFAFDGPRLVGRVSIRHHLNERLFRVNGHVLENIVTGPDLPKPKGRYWIG